MPERYLSMRAARLELSIGAAAMYQFLRDAQTDLRLYELRGNSHTWRIPIEQFKQYLNSDRWRRAQLIGAQYSYVNSAEWAYDHGEQRKKKPLRRVKSRKSKI